MPDGFDSARVERDLAVERVAASALILHPAAIEVVRPWLRPSDFTHPWHRGMYEAAVDLHSRDEYVDAESVLRQMQRAGVADPERRLPIYLAEAYEVVPIPLSAVYHAKEVLELAVRRQIEAAGVRLQQISELNHPAGDLLASTRDVFRFLTDVSGRWDRAEEDRWRAEDVRDPVVVDAANRFHDSGHAV